MALSSERIKSIYDEKVSQEARLNQDIDKTAGNLIERTNNVMSRVEDQYQQYLKAKAFEEIVNKANELLDRYRSSDNVPSEELDENKTGFDDARLLALIKIIEAENKARQKELH